MDAPALEDATAGRGEDLPMSASKWEIAELLGVSWRGDDAEYARVSRIEESGPESVVFAAEEKALAAAVGSRAGLILSREEHEDERVLAVQDARLAFAQVYARFFDERGGAGVHASAQVAASARVGEGCELGAMAFVGDGVVLGEGCVIGPRVTILAGTTLGARVRVQAGTVLGSDGFGFARGPAGYVGFPQLGTLVVEDDVEIGANCTIDRGALGETRIGRGTKMDNLVHIGHNCTIGEDVVMAAQVGIAGSTTVGDGAVVGGQVGLADHVTIGPGVILGAQCGVPTGKRIEGPGEVFWGTPARPIREYLKELAKLRRR